MMDQQLDQTSTPELNKALYDVQLAMKQPVKNKKAHYGSYADFSAIDHAVRAAIKEANNGISYIQGITDQMDSNGKTIHKIYTEITHSSGEKKIVWGVTFPDDANMQKQGASITYAKRISLSLAFGIVADEDDDGQSASLLDEYKSEQEAKRVRVIAYLKDNMPLIDKNKSERVYAVLGKKRPKGNGLDVLSYAQALILSGAVQLELSDDLSGIGEEEVK
ncbi:ERF superfamily protein [Lacticaseibacillus paracasei]|uniref:ERF family protein n=1 Tax=Lacticaseibacillus paracasei TaxID=1597 RepID=UPI000D764A21|nr:ERF family protein [Lacticaseibacillus paracasei]AWR91946.1 ERF superfamily protein [Lacticaseibacillus paracasei]